MICVKPEERNSTVSDSVANTVSKADERTDDHEFSTDLSYCRKVH